MCKSFLFSPIFFVVFLTACTNVSKEDIKNLEGYWEINSVKAHGETFTPKGNAPSVDYYSLLNDSMGIKKKLVPSFGEKYSSSEDLIRFKLQQKKGEYYLQFFNTLEVWDEKIERLSKEELVLVHSDKAYHYKRHKKITY